ncbi:DCL2-like protein [Mya arenaria]|uniref:DCL2-like protein n=1 Tax=Mya arenaria TaxID=6604 RepID=A0ABY7DYA1_MYAAR|nr:DCL2-like protein [Mya arenaria]
MTISAMLKKYPTRNILFLVDKVLLVMQQFNDETEQTTDLVRRKIRVAALCMGQQATHGIPLWKHDILSYFEFKVLFTTGFCKNILEKRIIRWEDFSLIVVDEVHHCEKAHPYNVILSKYHLNRTPERFRPTALGLTASPAGKASVQATVDMLNVLIANMGGAKLCIVENPECESTLEQFQSNANLDIRTPSDSSTYTSYAFENTFKTELNVYITYCVLTLAVISNISEYVNIRPEMTSYMRDSNVRMIADNFVEEELDTIEMCLSSIETISNEGDELELSMITRHVQGVCMARSSVIDGGVFCAIQELADLEDVGFDFARSVHLPTDALQRLIEAYHANSLGSISASPFGIPDPTAPADHHVQNLINELTTTDRRGQGISLVLVKQRATAHDLAGILQDSPQLQRAGLRTTTMVGHGDGSAGSAGGMSVRAQRNVLEDIKRGKYQVVVATSVAEEGVDWPECERVITMYPPSTVTALIQMRGRARRKDSKFIVLCDSVQEKEKILDIMEREQNMIEATKWVVQFQSDDDL